MIRVSKARFMEYRLRQQGIQLAIKEATVQRLLEEKEELEEALHQYQADNFILKEDLEKMIKELCATASFPLKLKDGTILNAIRVNRRPFYDSEWLILALNKSGDVHKFLITRLDDETVSGMVSDLQKINSLREIKKLCQKGKIYYD